MRTFLIVEKMGEDIMSVIEPPMDPNGGWDNTHIVKAYKDFIEELNPKAECIVVHAYGRNIDGNPVYPWETNDYSDEGEWYK